ncbi:DUF4062 domain-containing protein [Ideonella sp. B7]|uniref:DUF4062 domain-containing protein n=1 Tax=Ideonella benzenivorans TaxID=2831643 RepID=UPI001CEC911A|nr:DUF4062 domain-containing protein [Ideonella benzenivorans]MCA6217046.1 DUF4062 domain-containing protein [Ideonella benzenivorans]
MATPRVFISSTCYDLKYIRENLRYFVKTLGYEPILSEDGSVFYSPALHTHDACLTEIPNTQMFVLIIGGRYGGKFKELDSSITNAEYREAVRLKIPVFALVDSAVYNEHHLYLKNAKNTDVDLTKLVFPAVDSTKVFDFIDEVRGSTINNALVPFRDFGDIESYLRQQWAAMMFDFLSQRNEGRRVSDTLATLAEMNSRIEILSKQILVSVGTEDAKIDAELYEEMLTSEAIRDLAYCKVRPTPVHVFVNSSYRACAKSLGLNLKILEREGSSISPNGEISRYRFTKQSADYRALRQNMLALLKARGTTAEKYLGNRPKAMPGELEHDETEG